MPWVLLMAWRDSRGQRRRLLVYAAAIAAGIAALTALRGFGRSMERSVDQQAASLLGADLELESNHSFAPQVEALIDSLGGRQARQVELSSMVLLPKSGGTRLAQVRALEGDFPFYGELRTEPPAAARSFRTGRETLVDEGLMLQFGAQVGDSIRVGTLSFRIAGRLLNVPGETALRSDVQPCVFIPLRYLEETGLVQRGSRVEYQVFFQFGDGRDAEELAEQLEPRLEALQVDVDTAADRRRQLGRTLDNLYRYLGLGSFIALVLGGVGVASAIHTHLEQKLETVAVLRSLGAPRGQALLIYLLQAGALGFIGALAGALAGMALLLVLPGLLADFLPAPVELDWSFRPLAEGTLIGLGMALLFASLPLLAVRRASPLLALRASYEPETRLGDFLPRLLLGALALAGTLLLAQLLTRRPDHALYFTGGTALALALLALAARLLRGAARRFFPSSWSYVWRQGVANLYRPHNQTLLLLVGLGLGTFLVMALYLAQSSLLAHIARVGGQEQPNAVLFDIQSDQREAVAALVEELGLPLMQQVPVVAMRLAAVKGRSVEELAQDRARRRGDWALRREYRATYRDHLTQTEALVAGSWRGQVAGDTVLVSLEEGVAGALEVGVGDSLVFDVQGVPVAVVVGSLRRVDWQRIMPNFLVVFPAGALEEAPQFHVLVTRAADPARRAELQRRAVQSFPNLSVIDLDLVLRVVDKVLDKVAAVARFMALFSIATGLVVLIAAVSSSRLQRTRESALLRTLGASRGQVGRIALIEYLFLGGLGGLAGVLLALAGGWALTRFVFEIAFAPQLVPLLIALAAAPLLTLLIGLGGSRGVHAAPPLEVLRQID
ncbi:MAG: ABC transporter permease [Candidatus Latescibacteria bacterium]|nr:ABC transporter permease [Candidatus Latescibacterota bacterium]